MNLFISLSVSLSPPNRAANKVEQKKKTYFFLFIFCCSRSCRVFWACVERMVLYTNRTIFFFYFFCWFSLFAELKFPDQSYLLDEKYSIVQFFSDDSDFLTAKWGNKAREATRNNKKKCLRRMLDHLNRSFCLLILWWAIRKWFWYFLT